MNNVYSPTQLEFLKILAAADSMPKEAAMTGSGGWLWDSDMNTAGNLSGYGGTLGSILGSTAGAAAGTAAAPGIGTLGGGVAGGVAGGAAGRGLGHAVGSAVDWFTGDHRTGQKGFLQNTFNPGAMLGDGAFGLLPGTGKGLQFAGRGIFGAGTRAVQKQLGKGLTKPVSEAAAAKMQQQLGRWGTAKALARGEARDQMRNLGMQAYKAPVGMSGLRQIPGRIMNFGQNMGRAVSSNTGRRALGRQAAGVAAVGIPVSMAGSALAGGNGGNDASSSAAARPFANTQGYTQVVGNKNRGFSGVQAMQ